MISFGTMKEIFSLVGAPAGAVILVICGFELGWIPVETQASKSVDLTIKHFKVMTKQHEAQLQQSTEQLDALLVGLKEICFNTAQTNDRHRECGKIVAPMYTPRSEAFSDSVKD